MTAVSPTNIPLVEYETAVISPHLLPLDLGQHLWQQYDQKEGKLHIEVPSFKTNHHWHITAQGWVGYIPLTPTLRFILNPKVPLHNLFHMLAYAYELKSFRWLAGMVQTQSLTGFYEQLAHRLAQGVRHQAQRGLYKAYLPHQEQRPFVRGQLNLRQLSQNPVPTTWLCRYHEFTADLVDNQILLYTLQQIARTRLCRPPVQTAIRRALHSLRGITPPTHPFSPADCIGRRYHRLNQPYQPLHALCRFFLEHDSPHHEHGPHNMVPFLVHMARLYEQFVAQWLKTHLPAPWQVSIQESLLIGAHNDLKFNIDLVIYDQEGQPRFVLDTKYKTPPKINSADFNQIVTYAKAKNCPEAILVYPTPLTRPLDIWLDNLHIRTLTFALDGDLEQAGQQFLTHLTT